MIKLDITYYFSPLGSK